MKKKIFLIVSSLGAGGSERVYWLLSQYFCMGEYDVSVVFLRADEQCFSTKIEGIRFIDLKTIKASRSFFKLYRLLKTERPFAVFSTTDHINILTSMVAFFVTVPHLIARASNNPQQMKGFYDKKARFYNLFTRLFFTRFNFIVCQTKEMKVSMTELYGIESNKLKVIPNPVLKTLLLKDDKINSTKKRLIVVARLSKEKGLTRLLEIMSQLPDNYMLTIAGAGPLMASLKEEVSLRTLDSRVTFLGQLSAVPAQIAKHDLFVLSSYTEGFPNVVLEALSVGVPVVSFRVGGINDVIVESFNGYVAEQNDLAQFKKLVIKACSQTWNYAEIKNDVYERFALENVGRCYSNLLLN
ncbi:glycosyltransferase [Mucilaginibacter xinganensis]|uniref:Glycosyltransferase involved in cell wall bisynthesis n=1 Tax=Mucilaginibacter xinganensis TaxID=1234841 RepID=A0A223NY02_9SPHI|nr:glycosyltransferase [Mucilaginibacter xinganensis]ASU34747.1 Glycosyltransferase involved in cell wall bisynthesis [Mucilaginibacter xinganensis]